jgi:DNA-binding transcriptional MocR family regulator
MPIAIEKNSEKFLYQQVVTLIQDMKKDEALIAGDKLPSLRSLSQKLNISIPTVKQAYLELERLDVITARPKSGYYLNAQMLHLEKPKKCRPAIKPMNVSCRSLIEQVYDAVHAADSIPLGIANPTYAYPSDKTLGRIMRRVIAQSGSKANTYGAVTGYQPLKRQIAYRHLDYGFHIEPDSVLITNGAQEALAIAIQCVAKPGDVIAVESPTYFGLLELIESLGMLALEIPVCSEDGICLDYLQQALTQHPIKACMFASAINNPLGSFMSDDKRKEMVEILEDADIPLIEDDVYGDLYFGNSRPIPAQTWSKKGLVITCGSFSKTAAPSYRVGWLISERFQDKARLLKRAISCASSLLNQWTLSEFLRSGEYDRNVSQLRKVLRRNKERMAAQMSKKFPSGTRISDPQGGTVFWVEFPMGVDTSELFHQLVAQNVSIAPGSIFSAGNKFKRCARISFGLPWENKVEEAITLIGKLSKAQLA